MKRILFGAAVLVGTLAARAEAQQPRLALRPQLGVFAPAFPLVAVADGYNANVQLSAAPAAGLELEYTLATGVALYAGATGVFTRLHHSGIMELADADGVESSRAMLITPTAGLTFTPGLFRAAVQPTLRLGAGAKVYSFDLHHASSPAVDPTGDVGIGFTAGQGAVTIVTEARWLPSRFDARFLPIRTIGRTRQWQNDWLLQIGFRARP